MLWFIAAAFAADDTFYASEEIVSYADLSQEGSVRGRTGRVLVRAEDPAGIAALPDVDGVRVLRGGLLSVTPRAGVDDLALSRALHERPDVAWAHPDVILPTRLATPTDPMWTAQWHLENTGQGGRDVDVDIDAVTAWSYATGAGQLIAVLDSGVDLDHPDLSVIPGHDYVGRDDDANPQDGDSAGPHGTCAAGVAAALGNGDGVAGVAYDADIYAIRLIGGDTSTEDLYDAFVEAVDAGSTVLSNSWGFGTDCSGISDYPVFGDMFEYAETEGRNGLGSVVVFASGNGGCDIDSDGMLRHEEVVVVAALEGNDRRAGYSNYGDVVDIAAPTGLLTTDLFPGGYGSYDGRDEFVDGFGGTSAATPVVSGVVGLMIEANPRITAAEVREMLCRTAVRNDLENAAYDDEGRSPLYGCGRVDAGAAVASVANGEPAAPVAEDAAEQVGRGLLAWAPALDPDGDVLGYEVSWSVGGEDPVGIEVLGTWVDLGDDVAIGDTVTWQVRAIDPWGEGPWSEPVSFEVIDAPEPVEPRGCATSGTRASGGVWVLGLLAFALRKRVLS